MSTSSCKEFMETSTIHGLAEIARSKRRPERAFFVIALVICNGFSLYGCYQIVNQYVTQPVSTSIFIYEAENLTLPDVTVCLFNRLDKLFLEKHGIPDDLGKFIEWSFFHVNPKYNFLDFKIKKVALRNLTVMASRLDTALHNLNMSFEDFMHKASISCQDIVEACEHQYTEYNCCSEGVPILTGFGRCYRFYGKKQTAPGLGSGTTIRINIPLERLTTSENMLMNDGLLIKLTEPRKGYDFDAIFVPTGVHALLQLKTTELRFMNDPPRFSCHKEMENDDYAPIICYQKCLLKSAYSNCSCRYVGLPTNHEDDLDGTTNLTVCTPQQVMGCIYPTLQQKYKRDPHLVKKCRSQCESRCNYWQYHATVSYARYPSATLAGAFFHGNQVQKQKHLRMLEDRSIILELFYDKLEYQLIEHFPSMPVDQFISNIGGQLGLWMGGSILSLVHFAVFVCVCSRSRTKTRAERMVKQYSTKFGDKRKIQNDAAVQDLLQKLDMEKLVYEYGKKGEENFIDGVQNGFMMGQSDSQQERYYRARYSLCNDRNHSVV